MLNVEWLIASVRYDYHDVGNLAGTIFLDHTTAATNSGAYLIGTFDEFDNSDETNVQGVLDDLDASITNRYTKAEADARYLSTNEIGSLTGGITITNDPSSVDDVPAWDGTNVVWKAQSGAGKTNLTQFVDQTNWRLFYSDGSGDVQELAFGTSNQVLKSQGASAVPTWGTGGGVSGSYSTPIPLSFFATSEAGSGTNNSCQVSFETNANQRVEIRGLSYETNCLQTAYAYTVPFTIGEYPLMVNFASWQTNAFSYTIRTTTTNVADNLINFYLCYGTNQTAMATNIVSTTADTELTGQITTNATINALGDSSSIWWRVEFQSMNTNSAFLTELKVNYGK